jgi:hypothetical protein
MRSLWKLLVLGVGTLVVAGCGASTRALTVASFNSGAYVGSTSQGLPISLLVAPTSVESVRFAWTARCADGQAHSNVIVLGVVSINSGHFSESATLITGASSSVAGQLVGDTASGTLSRGGPSAFGTDCTADGVTWHADRLR